jgi:two-component system chemotaxis response regulator CheY
MPTILHVEDDSEHRLMLKTALRNTDFTLVEAVDGLDGLDKIRHYPVDLILLDLFMPRMDGFRVLEVLKADAKTKHIPIIILSAWPTGDNRERAKQAGAASFVAKPYHPKKLIELINKILEMSTIRAQTQTQSQS